MANHNLNHLAFYGIAISSVLALFKVVSVYGETSLKAPANIHGVYQLTIANSPPCLKDKPLELNIQQSGIYLFGHLVLNQEKNPEQVSLSGNLKDGQIMLSGKSKFVSFCPELNNQFIQLKGKIKDGKIVGNLTGEEQAVLGDFTGLKKAIFKEESLGH
jgi:hypothetical protein